MLVIFRRQWVNHERLSFPVAQVPLESFEEGRDGALRWFMDSIDLSGIPGACAADPADPCAPAPDAVDAARAAGQPVLPAGF